ncbi:MAG: DUF6531 domain-containing protein [Myxococcaceae bacterium]
MNGAPNPNPCVPGPSDPEGETCGDGIDNNCDGLIDKNCPPAIPNGCSSTASASASGGQPQAKAGPQPEDSQCGTDCAGAPVDMATGDVSFGPVELASLATPTGMPLRAYVSYSSRNTSGNFGIGWTLNLSQRVQLAESNALFLGPTGGTTAFDRPTRWAVDETSFRPLPDATLMKRALDGSNVGFYFAKVGVRPAPPCPPGQTCSLTQPILEPRVAFDDGSRAVFSESGELRGFDDVYGNSQQVPFRIGFSDGRSLPGALVQGTRSITFDYENAYSSIRANAVVGTSITPLTRAVIGNGGYLTDICVIAGSAQTAPVDSCHWSDESKSLPTECSRPGERSLYRFRYVAACGSTTGDCSSVKRLSEVMDERCVVVERHAYVRMGNAGVVARTSESPTESLSFDFAASPSSGGILSVGVTYGLAPANVAVIAPGSQEAATVGPVSTNIDPNVGRVAAVDATCCTEKATNRTWTRDVDWVPKVSVETSGLQGTNFYRALGGAQDPHGFGLVTREVRTDHSSFQALGKEFYYTYGHPTVRRPTHRIEPGKSTSYSFFDDDPAHPCLGLGGMRLLGLARYLCHVTEVGNPADPTQVRTTYYQYDTLGRLLRTEEPNGVVTVNDYYADDASVDPLNAGMLFHTSRSGGGTTPTLRTTYESYHFTGRPRKVTNPNAEVTLYEYDNRGRMTKATAPDGSVTELAYAAGDMFSVVVLPRGNSIHFIYDGDQDFGRLCADSRSTRGVVPGWSRGLARDTDRPPTA